MDCDWLSGIAAPMAAARCLELQPDALGLDGVLVAVPRHALDADRGDVAAEAAEPLDQAHLHARARRGERCREPGRARADHQHVGLVHDVDAPLRLDDLAERSSLRPVWAGRRFAHPREPFGDIDQSCPTRRVRRSWVSPAPSGDGALTRVQLG